MIRGGRVELYDNKYTKEKVLLAKGYLDTHKYRNQDIELLIKIYNECKQQNITVAGCKSCGIQRYYTGLQNYVDLGTIILAKQGIDIFLKDDISQLEEEVLENRVDLGEVKQEEVSQLEADDKLIETVVKAKKTKKA